MTKMTTKSKPRATRSSQSTLGSGDFVDGDIANVRVPAGHVVVHNHVKPRRIIGASGFRAWLARRGDAGIERCDCGWAPELGRHFRVKGIPENRKSWSIPKKRAEIESRRRRR